MSDIAVRDEQAGSLQTYRQSSIDRLQAWAAQAQAVSAIAADICSTSFAPQAYRGKPAEATAAILAGAELGFDPMASLRAFDNIQGTPAPKAMTLRAVAQGAGHRVRIVRSSDTEAVVAGLRRGEDEWQESTWTIERARQMGLLSKDQWQKQPAAMLVARATSEVCRWIASDAIMGMPYSAEEITDTTGLRATAPTRKVTAADIVREAVSFAPADDGPITEFQTQDILELFYDRNILQEDARASIISKVIGRQVNSINDLTAAEAEQVLTSATRAQDTP